MPSKRKKSDVAESAHELMVLDLARSRGRVVV